MPRNSQQDNTNLIWEIRSLAIGAQGIDLRRPSAPEVLSELLNARFEDQRTVKRRNGHSSQRIKDNADFVIDKRLDDNWVYGHGTVIVPAGSTQENIHHPISNKGKGAFSFGETEVVWTGDRLLTEMPDGPFLGSHTFWDRGGGTSKDYGVPAYLPVQRDIPAPAKFTGNFSSSCLTAGQRVLAVSGASSGISAVVLNRVTGVVVSEVEITTSGEAKYTRVMNSGGVPIIFWLDGGGLKYVFWNRLVWSTPTVIEADADAFNVTSVPGGCQLIWRVADELFAGRMSEDGVSDAPHPFGTELFIDSYTPNGRVAIAVAPNGDIAYAWDATSDRLCSFSDVDQLYVELDTVTVLADGPTWEPGLTLVYRGLKGSDGRYSYVVYSNAGDDRVRMWEVPQAITSGTPIQTYVAYNSKLASTAFKVGDEVFAWLYSLNSSTAYLAAGVTDFQVCGIADRELTEIRVSGSDWGLANVEADPNDAYKFTWFRPYNSGIYFRRADMLIGDMNFLPALSTALYGKSAYLAGSHCRQWDGKELGDAGFHDYPVIAAAVPSNAGGAADEGVRFFRVYAVRYNNKGERIQGAAVTSEAVTLGTGEDTVTLTINTVPVTNHDDVVLEVYSTIAGGTEFILSGTVANDRTAATVTYVHNISDNTLETNPGDPHAPGLDGLQELEEFGPLGCEILVTAADRLWGAGGQVPAGCVQFSKLYEVNEGVGFDALASVQTLSAEGENLTAIVAYGDQAVVGFTKETIYGLYGAGPDNFGLGQFNVPQFNITDGAVNQQGVAALPDGIAYFATSGPRILLANLRVENISEPVGPLANGFIPTGVRVEKDKKEVIWYSENGDALLWNYAASPRWARWTGVPVAGLSQARLVTPGGEVWTPTYDTPRDGGRRFTFAFATGNLTLTQMLAGGIKLRSYGMTGQYNGEHRVWFYLFYNNSPRWAERVRWTPLTNTWLAEYDTYSDATPAELDALGLLDQSGSYDVQIRTGRQDCRFARLLVTDGGDAGFTPWELSFEIAAKAGTGRQGDKDLS